MNGTVCTIVPDTGADITLVPGHLVYSHQLVDQVEHVKGVSGLPVEVQCADVPFEFEGRQFTRRVAVANKDLINDRVLFAVPLVVDQPRHLFLGAVDGSNTPETEHSGDTPDSQSSVAAVAATDSNTVVCSKSEVGATKDVCVLTRAGAKKAEQA